MVVRVDQLAPADPTPQLGGPVGDNLVGSHVRGRSRAGLKDVQDELILQPALGYLGRRRDDGATKWAIQRTQVRAPVGWGGLDEPRRSHGRLRGPQPADREILD